MVRESIVVVVEMRAIAMHRWPPTEFPFVYVTQYLRQAFTRYRKALTRYRKARLDCIARRIASVSGEIEIAAGRFLAERDVSSGMFRTRVPFDAA